MTIRVGYYYHRDGDGIIIYNTPWWLSLTAKAADRFCLMTRHWFCNSKPMLYIDKFIDDKSKKLRVPYSDRRAFFELVGWERWFDEGEESDETGEEEV